MTDTATRAIRIAARLDGQGGWTTLDLMPATDILSQDGCYWIHVTAGHPATPALLQEKLGIPESAATALLAEEIRPRYTEAGNNALLFLRGITMIPGPEPGDLASLRLWITPNGIVSASRRKSHVAASLKRQLDAGEGPRTVAEMVAAILEILNDALEPVLQEVDDLLSKLEDDTSGEPPSRRNFAELRREIGQYRRHLSPQRDMLLRLLHTHRDWMTGETRWQVQEAHDQTARFIEDLDNLRERSEIIADDLTNTQDMHLNRNIYILSVISVIFMPLTFLTGLLGMNVNGIPWADKPWAFAGIVGVAAVIALLQLLIFRRMRWL